MHNFSTSYFNSVFAGYTFGLALTIVVMNVFNAAQPALLYIVPSVLGAVALHAWQRKELTKVGPTLPCLSSPDN
jgi:minor histocompatibility antigen H13